MAFRVSRSSCVNVRVQNLTISWKIKEVHVNVVGLPTPQCSSAPTRPACPHPTHDDKSHAFDRSKRSKTHAHKREFLSLVAPGRRTRVSSACHNPPTRDYAASRFAPPPTCSPRNKPSRFHIRTVLLPSDRSQVRAVRPISGKFMRRVPSNAQPLEPGTNVSGMLCISFTCGLGLGCISAAAHLPGAEPRRRCLLLVYIISLFALGGGAPAGQEGQTVASVPQPAVERQRRQDRRRLAPQLLVPTEDRSRAQLTWRSSCGSQEARAGFRYHNSCSIVGRKSAACHARAMQQPMQQTRLRLASRCCPDGCAQSTLEFCMELRKSHLSRQNLIAVLCVPNRGPSLRTHPQTKQLHQVAL